MNETRAQFEQYAKLAPEYVRDSRDADMITALAYKYCEAVDKDDEEAKNIYISALMLKFWDNVQRIYDAVKATGYDYDDCASQLYKCISTAMEYRAWQDPAKNTTAKACINQLIASRGAPEIIYASNLDNARANVNAVSFDAKVNENVDSDDTYADITEDENESPTRLIGNLAAESMVQALINKKKLTEGIIADVIAFNDCEKEVKETKTDTDTDGKSYKYTVKHRQFWSYAAVKVLSSLDDDYLEYFTSRYHVKHAEAKAAFLMIKKANNQKLYKYLENSLNTMRAVFAREL